MNRRENLIKFAQSPVGNHLHLGHVGFDRPRDHREDVVSNVVLSGLV